MINQVYNSISKHIDYLEEQSVRNSTHRNDASLCSDDDVRSYTVTKLKTICSTSEEQFKWFKKLHSILTESDVYVPIEMRKYVSYENMGISSVTA